jgi:hypothetical protein
VRRLDLAKVFGGVAAVLLGLQLIYLVIGNALIRSRVIRDAVGSSAGFHLDYDDAYTLWPGHVRVHNLSLRVEDYNVQFEVALAKADVDISLSELIFKKFHATKLVAEGTRFRMRHKLIVVGDDAERVAAYPPIKGFADPPYFVGVRPPPIATTTSEHDLWSVRIENVQARVSELWVLEYRFQGSGLAHGSFVVKPGRWVQVEPAGLELEGGTLSLGEHRVAETMRGRITCDIPDMRVPDTEGAQVLRDIGMTIRLELLGGKLDFLRAYLARLGSARYSGNAEWLIDLNVVRGIVGPGSNVSLRATPFELHHELANLSGDVMLSLGRGAARAANQLVLAVDAPRITATRSASKQPAPSLEGVAGSLRIEGVDLKQELSLGEADAAIQKIRVPALAWFTTDQTSLRGAAEAGLRLRRAADGSASGSAELEASEVAVEHGSLSAAGDVRSQLVFNRGPRAAATLEMQKLLIELSHLSLTNGAKHSKPFALVVDGSGLRVNTAGKVASGAVRVHASSTQALLPLVLSQPLSGITSTALDLKGLDASANVRISPGAIDFKVVEARSGNLHLRGFLNKRAQAPRGAFLLSSGPLNVGLTVSDGSTEVSPFVGDDWLATTWSQP